MKHGRLRERRSDQMKMEDILGRPGRRDKIKCMRHGVSVE
jgi:hypothetical protein